MKHYSAFLLLLALLVGGCAVVEQGLSWVRVDPLETFTQANEGTADLYAGIPVARLSDGGFVLGEPDTLITLVEFGDFACPHCQAYHSTIKQFIEEFVVTGLARFEYRMFISGADPIYGQYTAQLAECADTLQSGAFWRAHDALFEWGNTIGRFNQTTARALADRLELDYGDLLACAGEADQWQIDVELGGSLGVQATPTIMYRLGEGEPQFISAHGQTFNRGPVPYEVLRVFVLENQPNI